MVAPAAGGGGGKILRPWGLGNGKMCVNGGGRCVVAASRHCGVIAGPYCRREGFGFVAVVATDAGLGEQLDEPVCAAAEGNRLGETRLGTDGFEVWRLAGAFFLDGIFGHAPGEYDVSFFFEDDFGGRGFQVTEPVP